MPDRPKDPVKPLPSFYSVGKADGEGPVQDWLAQIPDWQAERARVIDAAVIGVVPGVRKAVKWHGVWYGIPGGGWFAALNSFNAHLKLTFFDGCHLDPVPPDRLAFRPASAIDLKEDAILDEDLIADWVRQAQSLPGLFKA